ncbi:hypothetical protein HK097_001891 [Rhizophlyctis rosea]|uniref:Uncharacterized protein n=1 Tax=Rhizophlyctis rosea TaxID=64517 RepID=A0AAD5S4Y9_9FUNG|nr:hypothetical protein HK097_001891 [Rhizophlyctis rosea]
MTTTDPQPSPPTSIPKPTDPPSTPSPPAQTKKKKPPKPGSKAARALSSSSKPTLPQFAPPSKILKILPPSSIPNIIVLSFADAKSMTLGLGRPHIAYEGGQALKGPLKGVNMPLEFLEKWVREVGVEGLTEEERVVLDLVGLRFDAAIASSESNDAERPNQDSSTTAPLSQPLYLIAHLQTDKSTLLHEYAHAHYHLNPSYRAECHRLWDSLDDSTRQIISKELAFRNYREDVVVDEFQAYVVEGPGEFGKKVVGRLDEVHRILRKLVGGVQ